MLCCCRCLFPITHSHLHSIISCEFVFSDASPAFFCRAKSVQANWYWYFAWLRMCVVSQDQVPECVICQTCFTKFSVPSEWQWFFWQVGRVHFLNAYRCNLSICTLSQNAEWGQIAVMKLFHYGAEQCWINRNNKAECFIEPSVEVLWQRALLCLQH